VGRRKDRDFKTLGQGRGRRNKNRCVGRLRPATSGLSRPSSRVAMPDAACKGNRLCVSVVESQGKETAQLFCIRRRPSATGRKESRSTHRGRPAVRTSQFASQLKQLAGEQGESRTENRTGNLASRKDSDNARSVHVGRRRRNTGGTGRIPERCADEHCGELKVVG